MTTSTPDKTVRIERIRILKDALAVDFDDGRSVSLPFVLYPRLAHGSAKERNTYHLIGRGEGVHWPLLDEDLSAGGLLAGGPSREGEPSFQRWLKAHKAKSV